MATGAPTVRRIAGAVFVAIMLVIAALVLFLIWFLEEPSSAFWALLAIGWVALVFALVAYLLESAVANPVVGRAASYGFSAMGFTVLAITIGIYPDAAVPTLWRIELALVLLVALGIAALGFYWRSGSLAHDEAREVARAEWRAQPTVSAFDYAAAKAPSVPPPRSPGGPSSPPPGGN
jgi:peptidoglycan/LPS O-acetylase OafA/YrhL